VVEPGPLGGGSSVGCAGGAGGTATDATKEAGFSIDYVASQPGFVCRLNGKPSSDPCQRTPPQDAYWGLFWSDGKGSWKYSTAGASSLKVPEGGSIGWRFQDGGATDYPVAAPNGGSTPEPEPDPQPAPKPSRDPKPGGSGGSGGTGGSDKDARQPEDGADEPTPSSSPTPSASPSAGGRERRQDAEPGTRDRDGKGGQEQRPEPSPTASGSPTVEPSDEVTDALAPVSDDGDGEGGGGDPTMLLVAGAAVLLLGSAAGVTAWRRRS